MSVTAVPIRPLSRGSVLKLWLGLFVLVLAAVALAWIGTRAFQAVTLDSGVRFRVVREGHGPTVTPADLFATRYRLHVNSVDSPVIENSDETGQPFVGSTETVFPGFGEGIQHMRAGGKYILWLPPGTHAREPLRPGTPFTSRDTLVFELEVLQIAPGMAAMQQLMGQQGGGQPGAVPPGAVPPGAVPPGAVPPGAVPPGATSPHPVPPEGLEAPGGTAPRPPAGNNIQG